MRKMKKLFSGLLIGAMLLSVMPTDMMVYAADAKEEKAQAGNPYGGQDYYLDATGGDDNSDGTSEDMAWQTLAKVNATTFQPGDRILLKAGEVWQNQQLTPQGSGEEGKPITIDMYGDSSLGKPYIATNGNVTLPIKGTGDRDKLAEHVGMTGAISLRNQQYWEIHNMELSNDDDFNYNITSGLAVRDGISISINADMLTDEDDTIMNYFRISNCDIHDIDGPSNWQKIHYGGINFQVFGNKEYSAYGTGGYYFQDIRIENNYFNNCELHAVQFAFNWFYDRAGGMGEYDESGKWHEGWEQLWVRTRDLYSRDIYIANNYSEHTGQGAIQLANSLNLTCEYNEVNGFLERYDQVSAGLYLWASADSVMQFNEVYDGPAEQYDGTPFDFEYTCFGVTYQYNYTHNNLGGWMSYMGNSGDSIARYNLSVNDNGVALKGMITSNYSPTYITNNVFVYDGEELDSFILAEMKDVVYFNNNIFYNTSQTPTDWWGSSTKTQYAIFTNNAFYEASGEKAKSHPQDPNEYFGDPGFVGDPTDFDEGGVGVANIQKAAERYQLKKDSPLVDAGKYIAAAGDKDMFGTDLYYGDAIDIGIHEVVQGEKGDPLEDFPTIEELQELIADAESKNQDDYTGTTWQVLATALEKAKTLDETSTGPEILNAYDKLNAAIQGLVERIKDNLASRAVITATYSHPSGNYNPGNMIDGDLGSRWACADPDQLTDGYPIVIDLDFGADVVINKLVMDEYTDSMTPFRMKDLTFQYWNNETEAYETFQTIDNGIGADWRMDVPDITTQKLRINIESLYADANGTPTIREIQIGGHLAVEEEFEIYPNVAVYDKNEAMRDHENNTSIPVSVLNGHMDQLRSIEYYGPEGNKLHDLHVNEDYIPTDEGVSLTTNFLSSLNNGKCEIRFTNQSGAQQSLYIHVMDTTELCALIEEVESFTIDVNLEEGQVLSQMLADAQTLLAKINRDVPAAGNDQVTVEDLGTMTVSLRQAKLAYEEAQEADFTALEKIIKAAQGQLKNEAKYTISSWNAFITAYNNAIAVLENPNSTQAAVDNAVMALTAGETGLVKRGSVEIVAMAVSLVEEFVREGFASEEAWQNHQAALSEAQVLLARDPADVGASEIEAVVMKLMESQTAYSQDLVELATLKEMLLSLIEEAEYLVENQENYTPASIENLIPLMESARGVYESTTAKKSHVSEAIDDLLEGIQYVIEKGDKTGLQILVNMANQINTSLYTSQSVAALNTAKIDANAVIQNQNADQEMVQAAYDVLLTAIGNLVRVKNDFILLDEALALAEEILNNLEGYRPSTIEGLEALYQQALTVRNSEAPSEQAIQQAYENLMEGVKAARLRANIATLISKVALLRSIAVEPVAAPYDSEIDKILDSADRMINNADIEQGDVDKLIPEIDRLIRTIEGIAPEADPDENTAPNENTAPQQEQVQNPISIGQGGSVQAAPYQSRLNKTAGASENNAPQEIAVASGAADKEKKDSKTSDETVNKADKLGTAVTAANGSDAGIAAAAGLIALQPAVLIALGAVFMLLVGLVLILALKLKKTR